MFGILSNQTVLYIIYFTRPFRFVLSCVLSALSINEYAVLCCNLKKMLKMLMTALIYQVVY